MALAHRHAWGLNTNIGGCAGWTDNETLVYTAGHAVVLYGARSQWDKNSQKFVAGRPTAEGLHVDRPVAVAAERRGRRGADRATVKVYDVATLRRKKT